MRTCRVCGKILDEDEMVCYECETGTIEEDNKDERLKETDIVGSVKKLFKDVKSRLKKPKK